MVLIGPSLVLDVMEKVRLTKERIKVAQSRQILIRYYKERP